jgi:hypothetical protein
MNDALVAVNGFEWTGDEGFVCSWPFSCTGKPTTTVFINGERRTSHNPQEVSVEALMGFAADGVSGLQARRIPEEDLLESENLNYRSQLYRSSKALLKDGNYGACPGDGENPSTYQSVIAYSTTDVIFLVTEHAYTLADLCSTLSNFGATDAIRNDGRGSASLYLGAGKERNFIHPWGLARSIAYGVGLVRVPPTTICDRLTDSAGNAFGLVCVTPDSRGYNAEFITLDNRPARCGAFDFNLVSKGDLAWVPKARLRPAPTIHKPTRTTSPLARWADAPRSTCTSVAVMTSEQRNGRRRRARNRTRPPDLAPGPSTARPRKRQRLHLLPTAAAGAAMMERFNSARSIQEPMRAASGRFTSRSAVRIPEASCCRPVER